MRTFSIGGIHPSQNKSNSGAQTERCPLPPVVTLPLSQHIGAPAIPVVQKGDKVLVGQLIGRADGFISANVHSSVSGTVSDVGVVPDAGGIRLPAITITVEGDEWMQGIDLGSTLIDKCDLSPKQIVEKITAAGVVGMGGAAFPTHVKLSVPEGKKIEALIINGAECEPYLTSDHRVMIERGAHMMAGAAIIARALGAEKTYIGIEANKPDAIAILRELAARHPGMHVVPLKTRYPQGGEKQLIDAVLRRNVPTGGLPVDVGAVVQNASTALAVYEAVQMNKPLVERVVTVAGPGIKRPSNLLVRIGTPLNALIEACGGAAADTAKIISGGPMMGRAVVNPDSPVTKGTSGIVLFGEAMAMREPQGSCIKCTRCIAVCPMGLEPYLLAKLSMRMAFEPMEPLCAADCIECGCCSYICPSHIPLLDYIRVGKKELLKIIRARR